MHSRTNDARHRVRLTRLLSAAGVLLLLVAAAPIAAEEWKTYKSEEYGFSMLVPVGATLKEKEWEDGWGGLFVGYEGVKLWGLAKLGKKYSAAEIEDYGVKLTGIPEEDWHEVEKGENENGWIWYRTVKATKGASVIFGGYGAGPKGSYLLILKTTTADYDGNKADYKKWYDSIRLK